MTCVTPAPARVRSESSVELPTAGHRMIQIPEPEPRRLLGLCDGTRTRDQLLRALKEAGGQEPEAGGPAIQDRQELDALLARLAGLGLFVG